MTPVQPVPVSTGAARFLRHECELLAAGDDLEELLDKLPDAASASLGEQTVDPGWQDFQRWRAEHYVER